jgi:hypothetical protein
MTPCLMERQSPISSQSSVNLLMHCRDYLTPHCKDIRHSQKEPTIQLQPKVTRHSYASVNYAIRAVSYNL